MLTEHASGLPLEDQPPSWAFERTGGWWRRTSAPCWSGLPCCWLAVAASNAAQRNNDTHDTNTAASRSDQLPGCELNANCPSSSYLQYDYASRCAFAAPHRRRTAAAPPPRRKNLPACLPRVASRERGHADSGWSAAAAQRDAVR